jgi:hypothetical protein
MMDLQFHMQAQYLSDKNVNVVEEIGRQNFSKRELNPDLEQSTLCVS